MKSQKEEFLELLTNYQGIIHKVNLIYFQNKTDREDNFQEVVYQLWRSYPKLRNKSSIGSWIYSVAINTSISYLRKISRIEYHEKLPEAEGNHDPFEETVKDENTRKLLQAIHQLNDIDKSIMLLCLEEKSYEDISEILGITVTNVGVRINRAKESLKQNLIYLNNEK